MTETEAARRRAINRLAYFKADGWGPREVDNYHTHLDDATPDEVDAAVTQAIRDRTLLPKISWLRDRIREARDEAEEHRRAARAHPDGEGVGCPHCREAGTRGDWYGDGWIVMCATHNTGWRGRLQVDEAA